MRLGDALGSRRGGVVDEVGWESAEEQSGVTEGVRDVALQRLWDSRTTGGPYLAGAMTVQSAFHRSIRDIDVAHEGVEFE
jgi:hypothetical protein